MHREPYWCKHCGEPRNADNVIRAKDIDQNTLWKYGTKPRSAITSNQLKCAICHFTVRIAPSKSRQESNKRYKTKMKLAKILEN